MKLTFEEFVDLMVKYGRDVLIDVNHHYMTNELMTKEKFLDIIGRYLDVEIQQQFIDAHFCDCGHQMVYQNNTNPDAEHTVQPKWYCRNCEC